MHEIFVDADSCPVKDEVHRVASRHALVVHVVSNQSQRVPPGDLVRVVLVGDRFDEADDWIAERASTGDIVVTDDILLAARCLQAGARVLSARGRVFADTSIGDALAARATQTYLREMGLASSGPAPFSDKDRSRFLQRLDELVHAVRRVR